MGEVDPRFVTSLGPNATHLTNGSFGNQTQGGLAAFLFLIPSDGFVGFQVSLGGVAPDEVLCQLANGEWHDFSGNE
jgi:hypothetical protein